MRGTGWHGADSRAALEKPRELLHGKAGISNERSKRPLGQFFVVGNRQAPIWRAAVPKNHVAAVLYVEFLAGFAQSPHGVIASNNWQFHPVATSMTSSNMLGGTGSPCFLRLMM
jgi:hypothetical protein